MKMKKVTEKTNTALVMIQRNDAFTNTYIIAQNLGRPHSTIAKNIIRHEGRFKKLGAIYSTASQLNSRGRPFEIYDLNEQQAIFLMTLMDNSEKVLDFKMALSMEFVRVKQLLLEKQTTEWQQARLQGKEVRREETDAIKSLIELAKSQGGTHYDTLYMTYSKLVKALVGYDKRDNTTSDMLIEIMLFERTLDGIIAKEVESQTFYKEIYKKARQELVRLKLYWSRPMLHSPTQSLHAAQTVAAVQ